MNEEGTPPTAEEVAELERLLSAAEFEDYYWQRVESEARAAVEELLASLTDGDEGRPTM